MTFDSFNKVSIITSFHAQLCTDHRIVLKQSDVLNLKGRGVKGEINISEENI